MNNLITLVLIVFVVTLTGCGQKQEPESTSDMMGFTAPTTYTAKANAEVLKLLPIEDQQDFIEARRGLIASDDNLRIESARFGTIWDQTAFEFIQGKAPASVNPSLWRQAKLNNIHGLFKVTEGVYQLRGFDLSNMTIIEGKTGWIIVDPMTTKETTRRAFDFAAKHLDRKPIVAIIFTHSHADHYAGVTGIITPAEVKKHNVRIIAPQGFIEEAVSENSMAGIAMYRRSRYMYGTRLPKSLRGKVDSGLGKGTPMGTMGILPPNELITQTPQKKTIDGISFVFQNAPHSEAPAELTFYLPEKKAYCGAEIVSRHMHNIYTLRGAKVRNSLKWSNYIDEVIDLFGKAEIHFASHHWPIWGNEKIVDFLKKQRDIYKYIHDQTLRMANFGLTPREISEQLDFPESLRTNFSTRGYYGTLSHNAKAVYQFYFGWYDANPANLNPLPPAQSGKKYVEFMGGADSVLTKAQSCFRKGEYRWVAEVLNHLVFADPDNDKAKALLAKTYDQLGYRAESGPWRDAYLTGAYELRHGGPKEKFDVSIAEEQFKYTPISNFLDTIAVYLNGPKAEGKNLTINFKFTDINENHVLTVENSVLHHKQKAPDPNANATVTLTHDFFLALITDKIEIKDVLLSDDLKFTGSKIDLIQFFTLFSKPEGKFNIVTP